MSLTNTRNMIKKLKRHLKEFLIHKLDIKPLDFTFPTQFHQEIYNFVKPYTMTSPQRVCALIDAVQYVCSCGLQGSFVECGVWRGGSVMAMLKTLLSINDYREIYLFDTYDGMTSPTEQDIDLEGKLAKELLAKNTKSTENYLWCYAPLQEVQNNLRLTKYPQDLLKFVVGKVEDTIPEQSPDQIALLRLDTDWYESTYHELVHLFPRLVKGGVLIIDDYGHWQGARKAADQYFCENNLQLFLHRIDYSGVIAIKQ